MAYTTIDDSSEYFQTKVYTGTGSSLAVTNDGNSDIDPDIVWIKEIEGGTAKPHAFFDTVRGATYRLIPSVVAAEDTNAEYLKSFDSDGFTVGTHAQVNTSSAEYVAWQWVEGTTPGLDIIAYTGNATNRTIAHNLGVVPDMIWVKSRGSTSSDTHWAVYHQGMVSWVGAPETDYLALDEGDANTAQTIVDDATIWQDTAPTASVFSIGTSDTVNMDSATFISYVFKSIQGFSKFGFFMGNGYNNNFDGPYIHCGFKPALVITKNTVTAARPWQIFDNKRDENLNKDNILANEDVSEDAGQAINIFSNGFKMDPNGGGTESTNMVNKTMIYMAWAENPFVTSGGVAGTAN